MLMLPQPSVRLKLTLLYGVLFLATGIMLLALTNALLANSLRANDVGKDNGRSGQSQKLGQSKSNNANQRSVEEQVATARHDERETALSGLRFHGFVALLVSTAVALGFGWIVAGRVLNPLRAITAHARRASESTLGDRNDLRGPPDESRIAGSPSRMTGWRRSSNRFGAGSERSASVRMATDWG
jgi:hypothetical protein